jgi:hypothetical protein
MRAFRVGLNQNRSLHDQSKDRNTGADNPDDLGGGSTDKHLIYEGLSRVAADGVLAGGTATGDVFFSVWHPQLVELRRTLGFPEHPAQIVVAGKGPLGLERTRLFNVPELPVFVLLGVKCLESCVRRTQTASVDRGPSF